MQTLDSYMNKTNDRTQGCAELAFDYIESIIEIGKALNTNGMDILKWRVRGLRPEIFNFIIDKISSSLQQILYVALTIYFSMPY